MLQVLFILLRTKISYFLLGFGYAYFSHGLWEEDKISALSLLILWT